MPYSDPNLTHNPATGTVAPAAWGDVIRDDLEFFIDPPACSVKSSVSQLLANATNTVINCATETFDNDSMHSTVTNTSRITFQTPGRYLIAATGRFLLGATFLGRVMAYRVNGAGFIDSCAVESSSSTDTVLSSCRSFVFAAGDFIEVMLTQYSGGNLNAHVEDFTAVFLTR